MCSTCMKKAYGAVIVKEYNGIVTNITIGYNGSPAGHINCIDHNRCNRSADKVNTNDYDKYRGCVAMHAEDNAILKAGASNCAGATLYLLGYDRYVGKLFRPYPCNICMQRICNSGISDYVCFTNECAYIYRRSRNNTFNMINVHKFDRPILQQILNKFLELKS